MWSSSPTPGDITLEVTAMLTHGPTPPAIENKEAGNTSDGGPTSRGRGRQSYGPTVACGQNTISTTKAQKQTTNARTHHSVRVRDPSTSMRPPTNIHSSALMSAHINVTPRAGGWSVILRSIRHASHIVPCARTVPKPIPAVYDDEFVVPKKPVNAEIASAPPIRSPSACRIIPPPLAMAS
jgi:hypothetical protein